jgi:hypothetical protein
VCSAAVYRALHGMAGGGGGGTAVVVQEMVFGNLNTHSCTGEGRVVLCCVVLCCVGLLLSCAVLNMHSLLCGAVSVHVCSVSCPAAAGGGGGRSGVQSRPGVWRTLRDR